MAYEDSKKSQSLSDEVRLNHVKDLLGSAIASPMSQKKALKDIHQIKSEHYELYGKNIIGIVKWYLVGIGFIVLLEGFRVWDRFHLSSTVMIAMLSTTTANVLGLMYIVSHHLFPSNE